MILDIIVIAIVVIWGFIGMNAGFVASFLDMMRSLLAIIAALFLSPMVKTFLMKNTGIYNFIVPQNYNTFIPDFLKNYFIAPVTDLIFTALVFIILFFLMKWVFTLLIAILSPRKNKGFGSGIDGFLGLLFGLLKGCIIVCILIAVMLPLSDIINSSLSALLKSLLNASTLAKYIYNDNPLWLIARYIIG